MSYSGIYIADFNFSLLLLFFVFCFFFVFRIDMDVECSVRNTCYFSEVEVCRVVVVITGSNYLLLCKLALF